MCRFLSQTMDLCLSNNKVDCATCNRLNVWLSVRQCKKDIDYKITDYLLQIFVEVLLICANEGGKFRVCELFLSHTKEFCLWTIKFSFSICKKLKCVRVVSTLWRVRCLQKRRLPVTNFVKVGFHLQKLRWENQSIWVISLTIHAVVSVPYQSLILSIFEIECMCRLDVV